LTQTKRFEYVNYYIDDDMKGEITILTSVDEHNHDLLLEISEKENKATP